MHPIHFHIISNVLLLFLSYSSGLNICIHEKNMKHRNQKQMMSSVSVYSAKNIAFCACRKHKKMMKKIFMYRMRVTEIKTKNIV